MLIAFEFICKFLYLSFPRDIHNSFCIVVKAVAQKIYEPYLEFGALYRGSGHFESGWSRTRQSAPAERIREIGLWPSRLLPQYLCASEGIHNDEKQ